MNLSKYNTIGNKLILAFSGLTFLMFIVGLVAWFTWSKLDQHVDDMLKKSVPKYNASFVLESRSKHIKQLLNDLSKVQQKSNLKIIYSKLKQEVNSIKTVLVQFNDQEQLTLLNTYLEVEHDLQKLSVQLAIRLEKKTQLKLLKDRLSSIHQDIQNELQPLRQELQWELKSVNGTALGTQLLYQLETIQKLIDDERKLYQLIEDAFYFYQFNKSALIENIQIIYFQSEDLLDLSQPIFSLPSSISYKQLLDEMMLLINPAGELNQDLANYIDIDLKVAKSHQNIANKIEKIHIENALMVKKTDQDFKEVRRQTSEIISYGNQVLFYCFSLAIVICLMVTFYFINRRIVKRLNRLSNHLDDILANRFDTVILVDGNDEITRLTQQLKLFCLQMSEIQKTNALNLLNNAQASLITCELNGSIESTNIKAQSLINSFIDPKYFSNNNNASIGEFDERYFWSWMPTEKQHKIKLIFEKKSSLHLSGNYSTLLELDIKGQIIYLRLLFRIYQQGTQNKIIITMVDITEQVEANEKLELRVVEKTRSLQALNQKLMDEIDERIRAEKHIKLIQEDLLQSAKMAVVGQTMTSLAHELNQPLSAMKGYIYTSKLLITRLESLDTDALIKQIDNINSLTQRMGRIIKSLREFSKKRPLNTKLESVNFSQSVDQAILLLSHKAQSLQVNILHQLPKDLCVLGEDIAIEQVIINLVANSFDALSHQGIGSLKDLKQVTIDVVATNFNRVIISIMDTGEGFDLNVIDKLCLPFTTTKEIGLGLGLNISLSLMKQMKGDLFLGSTVTGGAMVILEFTSAPFLNVKKELIDDIE